MFVDSNGAFSARSIAPSHAHRRRSSRGSFTAARGCINVPGVTACKWYRARNKQQFAQRIVDALQQKLPRSKGLPTREAETRAEVGLCDQGAVAGCDWVGRSAEVGTNAGHTPCE